MRPKTFLLPGMAVNNIRKNASTYFPYLGVSIFAIFTFFSFDLILRSEVVHTLPRASYAAMLLSIGFILLGLIMIPFLYYTNSFLIKRRKRELGLYNILGLEKKHIGIMMLWESLIIYAIVMIFAVVLGILFSRLLMLLLLNLARISVDVKLDINYAAILDTMAFYALIILMNFFGNLVQVGKAKPIELMSDGSKGEKEPKHVWLSAILGLICIGFGYYASITSQLDDMVFVMFFLAVFLVVMGTYFLFTAGSIVMLRMLKKNKHYYYRPANFITVSGMLYRMKKNAASLSNICIFATMVIITVICTISVGLSNDSIISYTYPRSLVIACDEEDAIQYDVEEQIMACAEKNEVTLKDYMKMTYTELYVYYDNDMFMHRGGENQDDYAKRISVFLLTANEYNRMEGKQVTLEDDEILLYYTGQDVNVTNLAIGNNTFRVKEELQEMHPQKKSPMNSFMTQAFVVCSNRSVIGEIVKDFGQEGNEKKMITSFEANPEGDPDQVSIFKEEIAAKIQDAANYGVLDYTDTISDQSSMYGGLMFIGIFFGAIFLICFLVIMYYKQITEGFEDRRNFEIMQKVGMNDDEIKKTIKKQIQLVFALPLAGAILHTVVGMKMVILLMSAINCYEIGLMMMCTAAVCLGFAIIYGICYKRTSVAYYKIVKQM